jgi:hypothetical protein
MNNVAELIKRTEYLRSHVEALREELDRLREDLHRMQGTKTTPVEEQAPDCLAIALALAEDLGPSFSSEDPHIFSQIRVSDEH